MIVSAKFSVVIIIIPSMTIIVYDNHNERNPAL